MLGVSGDTVLRAASKVLESSAVLRRVVNGGNSKVYTEEQATLIKQEIQKHHNLASRQIDKATTKLEMMQNIQCDLQWLVAFNAELQNENKLLEQQNETLQIELDQSKEYITIKRMEKLNPKQHFNWRLFKRESERLHKPGKDTFDQNYGSVKAYHVDVWESLYFDSINYPA